MTRVLYEKRGRRYHPVAEYDSIVLDALPKGAHLVVVNPGVTSTRYNVDPAHAAVLASIGQCRDKIMTAIRESSLIKPSGELRPLERKAYKAYCDVMGRDAMLRLDVPSANCIFEALERAVLDAVAKQ